MPGQVERIDDVLLRQCLLVEEPVAEVAAEPVEKEDRLAAQAELEVTDAPAAQVDLLGCRPLAGVGRGRRDEARLEGRDNGVDLFLRNIGVGDDRDEGADGQLLALLGQLAAQHAAGGHLQPARDLVGLDVADLVTGGDAVADLPVPGRQPSFLHRMAPLRNSDGMDGGHGSLIRSLRRVRRRRRSGRGWGCRGPRARR